MKYLIFLTILVSIVCKADCIEFSDYSNNTINTAQQSHDKTNEAKIEYEKQTKDTLYKQIAQSINNSIANQFYSVNYCFSKDEISYKKEVTDYLTKLHYTVKDKVSDVCTLIEIDW